MKLDDRLHDRQTETGPADLSRQRAIDAEKAREEPGNVLGSNSDHRVVDGAPAARFLDTLRRCIEQPGPWLIP